MAKNESTVRSTLEKMNLQEPHMALGWTSELWNAMMEAKIAIQKSELLIQQINSTVENNLSLAKQINEMNIKM